MGKEPKSQRNESNTQRPARIKMSREECLKRMEDFPERREQFIAAVQKGTVMSETAERLKTELASLSVEERADLAHFLLETLPAEDDVEDEAAWVEELNRRIEEMRSGKEPGIPAEQVFAELRLKYS